MKKVSFFSIGCILVPLFIASNVYAYGGNCGSAIFQIENQSGANLTLSGISGDVTVISTQANNGQMTHIANLTSNCSDNTCEVSIASISGGSNCNLSNITLSFSTSWDGINCNISNSSLNKNSSSCNVCFSTESGKNSYPTMTIGTGGSCIEAS